LEGSCPDEEEVLEGISELPKRFSPQCRAFARRGILRFASSFVAAEETAKH
jgi:hypothetical protein